MSNRLAAVLIVGLGVLLGYLWQRAVTLGLPVTPLAVLAETLLIVWLLRCLDRGGDA